MLNDCSMPRHQVGAPAVVCVGLPRCPAALPTLPC